MKIIATAFLIITFFTAMAQGTEVAYNEGETHLKGYLATPPHMQGKRPGVVIVHAWMGITDHEKQSADKLAAMGYMALAADIYGEGKHPQNREEAGKQAGYYKTNRDVYRKRIKAAIDELIKSGADPEKIAVIGYCFGGTGALEAARAGLNVKGVVSFHGGLDRTDSTTHGIAARVLVLHGADDPYVSKEQIENFQNEMRAAKADWQMIYYADAVHAFTETKAGNDKSKGAAYNEAAAKRSWEHMKLFLKELFGE